MYFLVSVVFFVLSLIFLIGGIFMKVMFCMYLFDYNLLSWGLGSFSYEIIMDWVSCIFISVVLLISGSVVIYSVDYMKEDENKKRFLGLVVMFVMSSVFMVSGGGLISMMLGWDWLGVVSYLLVIYYRSFSSYKAGMITIMTNRVGDVMMLVSIGLLMSKGWWSYIMVMENVCGMLMILILVGACTKSAQLPFSAWLPEASAAPTPVSSLVHSSTLVTAGVFLLIRLESLMGGENELLAYVSLVTMMIAGGGAMVESDGKKIIASSTLSQLGFMMFSLSKGLWMLTYFHMVMHAFFKALSFMCMGSLLYGGGGIQDLRLMGGKGKVSCLVNQGFLISVMCLAGFPFFCAFFSKDLVLLMYLMLEKGFVEIIFFGIGVSVSVLYGLRLFIMSMVVVGEEKIYSSFLDKAFMNMGIFILMVVSLGSGSLYSWIEVEFPSMSLNFYGVSVGVVIMMIGGVLMMKIMSFKSLNSGGGEIFSKEFYFLGSMWNLGVLSGKLGEWFLNLIKNPEEMDQSWSEESGGAYSSELMFMWFMKLYNQKGGEFFLMLMLMLGFMLLM